MPQTPIDTGITTIWRPLVSQYLPMITLWNRLEGRPRTEDFKRALKAEIRDPLWMLSKQWQTGELRGEDAGSAIFAKVHIKTTKLTKYQGQASSSASVFDETTPLEAKVEQQAIPFELAGQNVSLNLRLLMGRQWIKLLKSKGLETLKQNYLTAYAFQKPDPSQAQDAQICAHIEVWQQFAAVAERSIDGYELYKVLKNPSAADRVNDAPNETALNDLRNAFVAWFEELYYQPSADNPNTSWKASQFEHQFKCAAPKGTTEQVFTANEYYHGHLDWYNLDIDNEATSLPEPAEGTDGEKVQNAYSLSFLPSPVTFPGMPHRRWWTLEDWKTNLTSINPNTTDLNQLMVLDFFLNYANDWLLLPFTLPVGSIANVEGLMVTNTFGENIWIAAAGKGRDEDWQRWSMFHPSTKGTDDIPADLSLVLLPAAPKVLESKPLEEIYMLRDEIANMVWGVETQVPLATGGSKSGKEAGRELFAKYQQLLDESGRTPTVIPLANDAKIQYRLVNSVPENWIPFVPARVNDDPSRREIQLQRAAMPRILAGADPSNAPKKVEPRTALLREGLDAATPTKYFLEEREVPRTGIRVSTSFQRTRWYNGEVFTWIGFRKQMGRGEGHSGLVFDQIIPKEE